MERTRQAGRSPFALHFRGLRTLTLVLAGILIWFVFSYRGILQYLGARGRRNAQRDNVESVKEEIGELEKQKQSLELGMFENEKSVREAYRLVRPGENLIVISEEEQTSGTKQPAEPPKSH